MSCNFAKVIAQGKKPLNFAELRKLGEFFPEDEDVDEISEA